MKRICTFAAVLCAAAVATAGTAGAATPKLKAYVNNSFKIGVTLNGKAVKSLKAGKYVLVVSDPTTSHNFHITGPGLDKKTSISGKGTFTWKVTLKKGVYTYQCDPHFSFMKGSFRVK